MIEPGTPPRDDSPKARAARTYEGWISIFEASTDFEADLVRDRLDEAEIPAVVLTQRDHSFNLNVGDLSPVHVMVKPEDEGRARGVLDEAPISDADLEAAAMAADVDAPDAHDPIAEARLDSGIDEISLDVPDDDDDA
ncbi:putative signal transducing protein [Rubrivirga sp. IMCC43871]|uniref:putative signal transducing protein n=1 Tax=Rubrivirga sp. IMCC43871 TaxID=3391575 RepID=UPI00399015D1